MSSVPRSTSYRKTPSDHYRSYRSGVIQVSGHVGLIIRDDLDADLPTPLYTAIQLRLQQHALALQVHSLPPESLDRNLDIPEWRSAWQLDGLLVYHQRAIDDSQRRRVRSSGAPCIWCNHNGDTDCVYYDEHSAMVEIVRRLVLRGHRRIAFVSFRDMLVFREHHYAWRERLSGYRHAMVEAGLPVQTVIGGDGLAKLGQLLAQPERPTAVLTPHHDDALGVLLLASSRSLKIPQQLSLVTFGDHPLAFPGMSVSTLVTPTEFLGATAVDLLIRQLELGDSVPSVGIGYDQPGEGSLLPPG